MQPYTLEELKQLYIIVKHFIDTNDITCPEVIYQEDRVSENSLDLIRELCNIVGYKVIEE